MISPNEDKKTRTLVDAGVRISSKWDGKHQGAAHVRDGVYWEAGYVPAEDERRVQAVLTDKRYGSTIERLKAAVFQRRPA